MVSMVSIECMRPTNLVCVCDCVRVGVCACVYVDVCIVSAITTRKPLDLPIEKVILCAEKKFSAQISLSRKH